MYFVRKVDEFVQLLAPPTGEPINQWNLSVYFPIEFTIVAVNSWTYFMVV